MTEILGRLSFIEAALGIAEVSDPASCGDAPLPSNEVQGDAEPATPDVPLLQDRDIQCVAADASSEAGLEGAVTSPHTKLASFKPEAESLRAFATELRNLFPVEVPLAQSTDLEARREIAA